MKNLALLPLKNFKRWLCFLAFACVALILSVIPDALAGQPYERQLGLQQPASTSATLIYEFHNMMLWIIIAIALFVLALLVWVVIRYNKRMNPVPSKTSHNVVLEIMWTVIPVVILIIIAIPSFQLLYYTDRTADPELTIKVTGYQWYWGYSYPDHPQVEDFLSYMIADGDINEENNEVRLLSTDTKVVLPIDTNIQILVTAADVLHSWAVPSMGLKMDAVPGRMNETWVNITKPGIYYGQCSELCGKDHAYMPIEIHAVTKEEFEAWAGPTQTALDAMEEQDTATLDAATDEQQL